MNEFDARIERRSRIPKTIIKLRPRISTISKYIFIQLLQIKNSSQLRADDAANQRIHLFV